MTLALKQMNESDYGISIDVTLDFPGFTGLDSARITLELCDEGGTWEPRVMTFYAGVATYITEPGDFAPGYHLAVVRASKAGESVSTDPFFIIVKAC